MPAFFHIRIAGSGAAFPGQSRYNELGGVNLADHTEVLSFYHDMSSEIGVPGQFATARLSMVPLTVVKAVDRITPMIWAAIDQNQTVDASVRWFSNDSEGATVEAGRIVALNGRITGVRTELPTNAANQTELVPLERISILPQTMRTIYPILGEEHEISWQSPA